MARQFSNPFPPARPRRAPKRSLSQASIAGDAHQQRADDEIAAAVTAVDRWYEKGGQGSPDIDLTDSCMAAVEAAEARDTAPLQRVMALLRAPYDEHPGMERYAGGAPAGWVEVGVSCSS